MKTKFSVLMAGAALLALTGAAHAAQPTPLTDTQMDAVTAGGIAIGNAAALALGAVDAVTVTQTSSNVSTVTPRIAIGQAFAQALAASTLTQAAAIAHTDAAASLP